MNRRLFTAVIGVALILTGCAGVSPLLPTHLPKESRLASVELDTTPFFPQTEYQCGPAALASVLQSSEVKVTPADLVSQVYLPQRKGSLQTELVASTRNYARLPYVIEPNLDSLLSELRAGHPVLVLQNLGFSFYPQWHYAVVIGYLPADDAVILRSGTSRRLVMPAARFLRTWGLADYWGLIVLRPGEFPARPSTPRYLKAAADLEAIGQIQPAELAYSAAVKRWPDEVTAWFGLGNTRYQTGKLMMAEKAYRRAMDVDPDFLAAHNNLAEALAARGCFDTAIKLLDSVLSRSASTNPLYNQLLRTRREIFERRPMNNVSEAPSCK